MNLLRVWNLLGLLSTDRNGLFIISLHTPSVSSSVSLIRSFPMSAAIKVTHAYTAEKANTCRLLSTCIPRWNHPPGPSLRLLNHPRSELGTADSACGGLNKFDMNVRAV